MILQGITRSLRMSEDTIILFISSWRTTNKLQLVLINVLIRSMNTKVLQGSVSTRLRCDGIFNDQFIMQSLLSPRVKKWKSVNICRSYGQLSRGWFFLWNTEYYTKIVNICSSFFELQKVKQVTVFWDAVYRWEVKFTGSTAPLVLALGQV